MKVIYLEADEEVTSIIERLREESSARVAFVVPRGALLLQSAVNLRLLRREAERQEKEVAIVTLDRIGRNLASQAGFSVYAEIRGKEPITEEPQATEEAPPPGVRIHTYRVPKDEASELPARLEPPLPPHRLRLEPPPRRRPSHRAAWLGLGLGLVLLVLFLPSATVRLILPTEPLTTEVVVKVDAEAKSNLGLGILHGNFLEAEEVLTERIPTSGKKNVGKRATGTITVSNRSGSALVVPSGSRFKTESGLGVRTTAEVTVPAAQAKVTSDGQAVITPGLVEASVEAEAPGTEYNLKGQTLSSVGVSGVAGGVLGATVKGELSGGTTEEKPVVAQVDIDQLKTRLAEQVSAALLRRFEDRLGRGALVFKDGLDLEELGFEVNPEVGTEASEVSGTFRVRGSTLSVLETEYQELVIGSARDRIAPGKRLIIGTDDAIAPQSVGFDRERKVLEIAGQLSTKIGPTVDERTLRGGLRAQSRAGAERLIAEVAPTASVEIRVSPGFMPRLPIFASRIRVQVTYE